MHHQECVFFYNDTNGIIVLEYTNCVNAYAIVKHTMTGKQLRRKRNQMSMTQAELAKLLGVARNTVARWERGEMSVPKFLHLALKSVDAELAARK